MSNDIDVLIAGGGPAGAALALLLHHAGHRVEVVTRLRDYPAIEGISRRSGDAMARLGLNRALATAHGPVARRVHWGNEDRAPNQEWLLPRPAFDRALLADLRQAGVSVREARVRGWHQHESGITVELADGRQRHARWGVEARGRQAARGHQRDAAPWATPALILRGSSNVSSAASLASSLPGGGWGWWARAAGHAYLQLALPQDQLDEARGAPLEWLECHPRLARCWDDTALEQHYLRPGLVARTLVRQGRLWRLGDAAMSVDPLSGQGIFNALSSAHGLAPVILGALAGEPLAPLTRFHQRRQDLLYWRFARAGRDFFRLAAKDDPAPYWLGRCHWPDHLPMHAIDAWARVRVGQAAAIIGTHLRQRELVITPDQPLGIYAVSGVALAPLVAAMKAGRLDLVRERLADLPKAQATGLRQWWAQQSDWPALPLPVNAGAPPRARR
ncbi:FAD-dependent oxidoreductase [Halomonas litopenaei]|uniref:FAD-dependent oxidoreductase n=1 Tax=Halomonas litopenaei TaxID=2109328 RepID=A0ABX5IVS0_9GAMM|nr:MULTISPECIES: FAD-dependent monooxygenase [Halomonas]MBS8269194.1 FAD-dependent oxidoreductase [Halomonas litopenaei]PTL90021.1 FAD-dependent oxidoreductase [Halomonas sp. SYSU XM8]PTL92522.1 FAD-dependent oxidoreductase [Halomonas litopenaei]